MCTDNICTVAYCRAQRFHDDNLFSIFAGKLCGLLAVLAVPSILKILIHTKASSTSLTAYKRYMQTIFHTLTWYESDLKPGTRYLPTYDKCSIHQYITSAPTKICMHSIYYLRIRRPHYCSIDCCQTTTSTNQCND